MRSVPLHLPAIAAVSLLIAAISACSPDNVTPPDTPAKETWTLEGWNDSANQYRPDYYGEAVRLTYNPDSTIKDYVEDTLRRVSDDMPTRKYRFIRENGRITRVKDYSSMSRVEYERAVIRYDAQGRIHEIDDYQINSTPATSLLWTRKFTYNNAGKLAQIETWRNGNVWETRSFEWSGDDMVKTKRWHPGSEAWEVSFVYDSEISPETKVIGVGLQNLMITNEQFELMSRHRLKQEIRGSAAYIQTFVNYTYTYTNEGLPESRTAHSPQTAVSYPKRAYLYRKN